ncbi:hypothetical protein R3P38DRAFT_2551440 [Favolaschia claudopus]|uniref:DUF6532 domain-containing protein n=1 Tax=Favolaschia claudopus TaxID=2862362 RepID=A0AAW0AG68_9AGAR
MGISLVPKAVELDVEGKVKTERKPKTTNADLPFPRPSYHTDLKFWQTYFLPELWDYAATSEEPFSLGAAPGFRDFVQNLWEKHYGAYTITDAVYSQAAQAVRNWRSKIGKTALAAVNHVLKELPTLEERAKRVADELKDTVFLVFQTGAYRSELVLRVFAAHLQAVHKNDAFYGHPVGAMALTCAAVERALNMYKSGTCSTDGVPRRGKRSALSFVVVPWGARAKAYLPGIRKLTTQKWSKIMSMSYPFMDSAALITIDDTDGEESSEDSRACIQVSDDSDEEEVTRSYRTINHFYTFG